MIKKNFGLVFSQRCGGRLFAIKDRQYILTPLGSRTVFQTWGKKSLKDLDLGFHGIHTVKEPMIRAVACYLPKFI